MLLLRPPPRVNSKPHGITNLISEGLKRTFVFRGIPEQLLAEVGGERAAKDAHVAMVYSCIHGHGVFMHSWSWSIHAFMAMVYSCIHGHGLFVHLYHDEPYINVLLSYF